MRIRPEARIKISRFAVQASVSILGLCIACTEILGLECLFQLDVVDHDHEKAVNYEIEEA